MNYRDRRKLQQIALKQIQGEQRFKEREESGETNLVDDTGHQIPVIGDEVE